MDRKKIDRLIMAYEQGIFDKESLVEYVIGKDVSDEDYEYFIESLGKNISKEKSARDILIEKENEKSKATRERLEAAQRQNYLNEQQKTKDQDLKDKIDFLKAQKNNSGDLIYADLEDRYNELESKYEANPNSSELNKEYWDFVNEVQATYDVFNKEKVNNNSEKDEIVVEPVVVEPKIENEETKDLKNDPYYSPEVQSIVNQTFLNADMYRNQRDKLANILGEDHWAVKDYDKNIKKLDETNNEQPLEPVVEKNNGIDSDVTSDKIQTPVVEEPDNSVEVSVETDNESNDLDDTLTIDMPSFMAKEKMEDYTPDELKYARQVLGMSDDKNLTEDDMNLVKANSNLTPEKSRKVVMIDKANEFITKAIDGVKAHKALTACAAFAAAVVAFHPWIAGVAVAAGVLSEVNKGRGLK